MTPADGAPRGRILPVLFLGVLMGALDVAIVGPALPDIGRTFGVDERALAWVWTAYVLLNLVATPLTARLSDLYGRRPLYVASLAAFGLGSLVVALAPTFPWLLVGRALQGLGAGGVFPVATAVVGDVFPPERRGRALGMLGAVFGLAFLIGPLLGAVLLRFGWPWLFLVNLPLVALVIAGAWRVLPAGRRPAPGAWDAAGAALLTAGLTALALGVSAIDASRLAASLAAPRVWGGLAVAALALAAFWWVERSAPEPLVSPQLWQERPLAVAHALFAVAGAVEAGLVFVPSLLVKAFGVEPATASLLLLPPVLALAAGAPLAGYLLDRRGPRAVVLGGTLLLAAGLAGLGPAVRALPLFTAVSVAVGLGLASLSGAPLRYLVLDAAPPAYRAAAQAVGSITRSVGRMLGGVLVGALVASHAGVEGYRLAFAVLAAIALGGAGLALGIQGQGGRPAEASGATPA